ncbi:hypothetical protein ACFV2H_48790 [Streptomyces sp. NPDC059629]|uniref:hypothetical protein n=1 Tax=Streptomyces sp. NPDC059629 TaxID=3346889 RepID=UPI003699718D
MTETSIRPTPRTTAFALIKTTALDHVAHCNHSEDEPPPPNREMYNDLTSVLENWHAADTLREDSLLLAEWLAVELCGYLYGQLNQDRGQLDQWLREFGDQVCRSQMHAHPAGPTAVEIMSVVADGLATRSDGLARQRLVRIGVPYVHYVRQDHVVQDTREIALTFALWAGPQLAELMRHDVVRINDYLDSRLR